MEKVKQHFCVSCNREISTIKDSVIFKCPNCGNELARCGKCRGRSVEYVCKVCGFEGP